MLPLVHDDVHGGVVVVNVVGHARLVKISRPPDGDAKSSLDGQVEVVLGRVILCQVLLRTRIL